MLLLIEGLDPSVHRPELDAMLMLRKSIFSDRLGWSVHHFGAFEVDQYDFYRPLYVLKMDDTGKQVLGSFRLLPTTGPNMLNDTFTALLPGGEAIHNPLIWDCSRFCVDTVASNQTCTNGTNIITAELLLAVCEIGIEAGLEFVIGVTDFRMERIIRRYKCMGERLVAPVDYGATKAVSLLWQTNQETLEAMRQACGISYSVLGTARRLKYYPTEHAA